MSDLRQLKMFRLLAACEGDVCRPSTRGIAVSGHSRRSLPLGNREDLVAGIEVPSAGTTSAPRLGPGHRPDTAAQFGRTGER